MDIETLPTYLSELLASRPDRRVKPTGLLLGQEGVVLVGAGRVGQEFLEPLRASEISILAFSDNSSSKWGTSVSGVPVLAPKEAVSRFAEKAVFIVTAGRMGERIRGLLNQFSELGAKHVLHFPEAIRFIPRIWPHFFLDPDVFSERDFGRILDAYRLFGDEISRTAFIAHLKWRMTLDPGMLPIPQYDNQYFPADIITPRHCAVFVDIGAYTGDTLLEVKSFAGDSLHDYYGFEPDPHNYKTLASHAANISGAGEARIVVENIAIGASEKFISFSDYGSSTSHAGGSNTVRVLCKTLDSMAISNPSFVKIDTEGFEDEVLRGGDRTLKAWKPTVAIAAYHRPKDLFEIPLRLADFSPDYKFYLRPHGDAGVDLVCYAVREATRHNGWQLTSAP